MANIGEVGLHGVAHEDLLDAVGGDPLLQALDHGHAGLDQQVRMKLRKDGWRPVTTWLVAPAAVV